jgi:hypothetical protein
MSGIVLYVILALIISVLKIVLHDWLTLFDNK